PERRPGGEIGPAAALPGARNAPQTSRSRKQGSVFIGQEEIMELPGSAYLYTLATLSMTFAGFSAVVILLCQTIGREISGFHVVLMRLYIEAGLWAAGFCMLPPLLCRNP